MVFEFGQLGITLAVFIVLFLLSTIPNVGNILMGIFLGTFFLFISFVQPQQATFYAFMLLLGIFMRQFLGSKTGSMMQVDTPKIFGGKIPFFSLGVGILLIFIIRALAVASPTAAILGTPALVAGVSGAKAFVTQNFQPAILGALGIIENIFFFGVVDVLQFMILPIFGLAPQIRTVFAVGAGALLFALFHIFALGLSFNTLLWTMLAFIVFSVSRAIVTDIPANVAHFWHNASISLGRSLAIFS